MKVSKIITAGILLFSIFSPNLITQAETSNIASECNYNPDNQFNPSYQTMNCLLTEIALDYDVPPEIVKAIAEGESGDWKHYDEVGQPIITADGGIGIMQITNKEKYDEELLKTDILYNIRAGVETLDYMFSRSDLPTINDGSRDVLEHWYFAIMAYNGTKPVNSPIIQATGERNTDAYQEKIITIMENYNLIDFAEIPFTTEDFQYDSNSTNNIQFVTMNYDVNLPFNKTAHKFRLGQKVGTTTSVHLRTSPTTNSVSKGSLAKGEILEITGPFVYEEVATRKNHFVWYPVKTSNGTTGYVASSYLEYRFSDVPAGHYAEDEIYYLNTRNILKGIGNDQFGMSVDFTRWQAVLLITRANNTSLENRPDPGFKDVPKTHPYYKEIAAAVDEGLFQGTSPDEFEPNKTMTRAEMAVVLQRLYDFPEASKAHSFTDLEANWYIDAVARLYSAGITEGVNPEGTKFGPGITVTREQFAVFMVRAMDESYRLN